MSWRTRIMRSGVSTVGTATRPGRRPYARSPRHHWGGLSPTPDPSVSGLEARLGRTDAARSTPAHRPSPSTSRAAEYDHVLTPRHAER